MHLMSARRDPWLSERKRGAGLFPGHARPRQARNHGLCGRRALQKTRCASEAVDVTSCIQIDPPPPALRPTSPVTTGEERYDSDQTFSSPARGGGVVRRTTKGGLIPPE